MSAATTTTNTSSIRPAIPKKACQRGRNAARRRAVIADGSLQVGDASRGGLKTSPSFSPAYLLAALEWAEDGENRGLTNPNNHKPGLGGTNKPNAASTQLAHAKAASNLRLIRQTNDDLNTVSHAAGGGKLRASRPHQYLILPEKLVFPSRKTPASFLPTPSSVSLDTAVKPAFSSSPAASPGSPFRHRDQHRHQNRHQHQHQLKHLHQHQQRPRTSQDVARRRWYHGQEEAASFSADEVAQPKVETDRIFPARQPADNETEGKHAMYQLMQPPAAPPPSTSFPSPPRQPQGPVREAFAFLTRGRKKSFTNGSPHSTLSKRSHTLQTSSTSTSAETDASEVCQSPGIKSIPEMPRSSTEAHNPTAKSVDVRCKGTTVTVQVTKDTSTTHLLLECSQLLAKLERPINPDNCVVIEPCLRPGLERRLRQYELIWDVINAWDHDSSNTLIIQPDSSDPARELSLASVPKTLDEPAGFVLPLHFLQRPGKWVQRYITLKENGQIFASKKQDSKPSDKDFARLCHLSDFDLYMPTEAEMRKQLRPPKRNCYAIRSQEKASLFLDSTHYVHFFCTEDRDIARQFRSSVQGWRSWYLVNKKLQLQETRSPPASHSKAGYGHRTRASVDLPRSSRSPPSSRDGTAPNTADPTAIPPVPRLPTSLRGKPAEVFAAKGLLGSGYDERKHQAVQTDIATRQQRGTPTSPGSEGPFIDGPNLLNSRAATASGPDGRPRTAGSDGSHRTASSQNSPGQAAWFPSAIQHSAEQRNTRPAAPLARRPSNASHAPSRALSTRQREARHHHHHQPMLPQQLPQPPVPSQQPQRRYASGPVAQQQQQPLIDLTPTFVEPPQWSRENRGRGVRAPQGKPLVDLATGPAMAPSTVAHRFRDGGAAAPPKNLVRRPEANGGTLMQQYDQQQLQKRGRGNTLIEGGGGGGGGLGLVRRNTVRSTVGGGGGSSRPATAGTDVPVPSVAAYMQNRGRAMGVNEGDVERVRERMRSGRRE